MANNLKVGYQTCCRYVTVNCDNVNHVSVRFQIKTSRSASKKVIQLFAKCLLITFIVMNKQSMQCMYISLLKVMFRPYAESPTVLDILVNAHACVSYTRMIKCPRLPYNNKHHY